MATSSFNSLRFRTLPEAAALMQPFVLIFLHRKGNNCSPTFHPKTKQCKHLLPESYICLDILSGEGVLFRVEYYTHI